MTSTLTRSGTDTPTTPSEHTPDGRNSPLRRWFGVVTRASTYRNLGFLVLGLPLGTLWFTLVVTGVTVSASMIVVALVGIPMLLGMWYVTRALANVDRTVTNVLLDRDIPIAPFAADVRGNVWVRLRTMSRDRARWREVAYLVLRFPAGIGTATAALAMLWTSAVVASAPIVARVDDEPFGDWAWSDRLEDIASSAWSWAFIPVGALMLVASLHAINALADACGRWAAAWLTDAS